MQLELKQRSSMQEIQKNPENEDIVEKIFNDKQEDNLMELLEENIKVNLKFASQSPSLSTHNCNLPHSESVHGGSCLETWALAVTLFFFKKKKEMEN